MFTDGIPLFKSSGVSLWPVYLLINEIPRKQRFLRKNMILWGVWQGAGKPNMTMFLTPLVQDLNSLYSNGMKLNISGHKLLIKAKLVLVTMDLQARAWVLHMTQHNGRSPCNFCVRPGEVVASGKGHTRAFFMKKMEAKKEQLKALDKILNWHNNKKGISVALQEKVFCFICMTLA